MCDASNIVENTKINATSVKVRSKLKRKRKNIEEQENNSRKRKADSDKTIPIPLSPVLSINHTDESQTEILDQGTPNTDERINNTAKKRRGRSKKSPTSPTKNDSNISLNKIENMKQRKQNELALKEIKKLPNYNKIHQILTEPDNLSRKRKQESHVPTIHAERSILWNTNSYLMSQIEKCLLQNDWKNFTKLLVLLTDAPKKYKTFVMKTILLNFICNPASQENDLHFDYLKQGLSCQNDEDINKLLTKYFHLQKGDALQENNNM